MVMGVDKGPLQVSHTHRQKCQRLSQESAQYVLRTLEHVFCASAPISKVGVLAFVVLTVTVSVWRCQAHHCRYLLLPMVAGGVEK